MGKQVIDKLKSDIGVLENYLRCRPPMEYEHCFETELINDMHAAIRTIQSEQKRSDMWIPISERYPENENPVEVTARRKEGARGYFIYKAHYVAPHTRTTEDYGWEESNVECEYDKEKDCYWVPECWYEDNAIEDNGNWILNDEFDILAWKPLPEPYKEESK